MLIFRSVIMVFSWAIIDYSFLMICFYLGLDFFWFHDNVSFWFLNYDFPFVHKGFQFGNLNDSYFVNNLYELFTDGFWIDDSFQFRSHGFLLDHCS